MNNNKQTQIEEDEIEELCLNCSKVIFKGEYGYEDGVCSDCYSEGFFL